MVSPDFTALFQPLKLDGLLEEFLRLSIDEHLYAADGCELNDDQQDSLKYAVPEESFEKCQNLFVLFGQATHSGSLYAVYKAPGIQQADQLPIVVFGDEGGALVLASNVSDFLSFLTLDVQPYVGMDYSTDTYEFDLFNEDEDEGEDEGEEDSRKEFKDFVKAKNIEILKTIDDAKSKIIKPAQDKYQAQLNALYKP